MPRKPVEKLRVPLNCFVAPVTKESITDLQNETRESQGEIVDRAVALLALGEEIEPPVRKKESRKDRAIRERAQGDVLAKVVGRDDIDYSDVESTPTTNVASLDAVGVPADGGRGKATIEVVPPAERKLADWRANRKPLPKPGERKS